MSLCSVTQKGLNAPQQSYELLTFNKAEYLLDFQNVICMRCIACLDAGHTVFLGKTYST